MRPKRISRVVLWVVLGINAPESAAQQPAATPSNVPLLPPDIPADATLCSVLMMGTLAGQEATWKTPDGKMHVFFSSMTAGVGRRHPRCSPLAKMEIQ